MSDCVFCRIIAGDLPCHEIYRDDSLICFLDIAPASPGHTLIVPLAHHDDLFSMSEQALAAVAEFSRRFAPLLKSHCDADGVGVYQFNGAEAGQTVFHYHMHLVPAYAGRPAKAHGREPGNPKELAELAGQLRNTLQTSL